MPSEAICLHFSSFRRLLVLLVLRRALMVEEPEEFGDRVELVDERSNRDVIIPSAAWLSRFCSSHN
eukprot:3192028-Pyramimonas_sp.AAC.1